MKAHIASIAAATFACACVLALWMRRLALARGILDVPNSRSSHKSPTPRGGGVGIVVGASAGFSLLYATNLLDSNVLIALLGGGIPVALVGLVDDYRPLPARIRMVIHVVAAVWALAWLGGVPPLRVGSHLVQLGYAGYVVGVLGIVWTLNLVNFMDGIDGIAASEAVFIGVGAAVLVIVAGGATAHSHGLPAADLVLAAACCGFLCLNWPPARIFMGDVGSGYVGFSIAVLALATTRQDPAATWEWLLLGGVFFVDATLTLVRRVARGKRAYDPHRDHAYQWLARRWRSHRPVTLTVIVINVLWCLPCALWAALEPEHSLWILAGGFIPLTAAAWYAGAGTADEY
jgi:Fuc2NAc and GlcNAc transferase